MCDRKMYSLRIAHLCFAKNQPLSLRGFWLSHSLSADP
ncbi:hypothetical protein LEP1GSC161_1672 [Leptospira santarosai str. CBC1416]|uniref:Uncharacterized protein n=1 Tax=Leptospira santarosai str. CBC1416 TaxID=1193059 RepID=M6VJD7_9LEPT|nr:hypothetical protein LEP1GSC161_1672 [Leptospira santarosai str. CBC1416]